MVEQDDAGALRRRLPPLAGGWETKHFEFQTREEADASAQPTLRLLVPREPEGLLEDTAHLERRNFNESMPYWAWLWDSAPRMASLLVDRGVGSVRGPAGTDPPRADGVRVLEIGAGLGLVGLAVAHCTRAYVTLSDHEELALTSLRAQVELNELDRVQVEPLDWNHLENLSDGLVDQRFDAILGSEVIYESGTHVPILALLERLLAKDGEAWFADPGRTRSPGFQRRASDAGFDVEVFSDAGHPTELERGRFALLRLRRTRL